METGAATTRAPRRRLTVGRWTAAAAAAVLLLLVVVALALLRVRSGDAGVPLSGVSTRLALEPVEITQIAAGDGRVVWTTRFEATPIGLLHAYDLDSGERTELMRGEIVYHGLASVGDRVVYAVKRGATQLVARSADGPDEAVLSRNLVGAFDTAGEQVAWPEQVGDRHRVVVENVETGEEWVAATLPRCEPGGRCYRIDAVRFADDGVVFARGAVGPHPSQIVRRAFDDPSPSAVDVRNDPQPDLFASSAGALYFDVHRGMLRWDFGTAQPRRAQPPRLRPDEVVVGLRDGLWLVVARQASQEVLLGVRANGSRVVLAAPPDAEALALLADVDWSGERVFGAWNVQYATFRQGHTHGGASGVVAAGAEFPEGE